MKLIEYIESIPKLAAAKELVFFGGSFNPWHEGHTSCLKLFPNNSPVIVIPDHNPFKELITSNNKLSGVTEIKDELSRLATETHLFDGFMQQDTKNPSHVWIKEIKKTLPNKKISLLIGFDTFIGLDKWINAEVVLNVLSNIYVASRLDNPEVKNKQYYLLKSINPGLNIEFLGNHPHEKLSSTAIRKRLK